MKTIREWLQELPEPYRCKAITYIGPRGDIPVESLADAVEKGFEWCYTTDGMGFWMKVHDKLAEGKSLTANPKRTTRAVIRYDIIEHITHEHFVAQVKARLDDGWELHGQPFSRSTAYCQCVVEYGEVELT